MDMHLWTNQVTVYNPLTFFLIEKNLCRKCSENCKTCTEFHDCTECRDGLR